LLGWLHAAIGVAGLAVGIVILSALVVSADRESRAGATLIPLILILWAWIFVPSLAGGIGLLFRQRWARTLLVVLSVMELLLFPVGTAIGVVGLWILLGHGIDEVLPAKSPLFAGGLTGTAGVMVAIAGVGAGFVVAIGAGFMISGDTAPQEISALFYPAICVLLLAIAYAVYAVFHQAERRRAELAIPSRTRLDDHTS
jgi:hypothetical protein